jgi:hypothetical protein
MNLSFEKQLVLGVSAFLFITFLSMAMFMEQTVVVSQYGAGVSSFDATQPVQLKPTDEYSSNPQKVRAMIKGSIYETGSNMTVFGACFDGDMMLLPAANASFTAWYPNGTIVTGPNASMDKVYDDFDGYHPNGTGRWKIHVTMGSTIGTYLTEMRCDYDGQYALAFGEWQNPEWVKKIGDTLTAVNGLNGSMSSLSNQITNLSNSVDNYQNITQQNFSQVLGAISNVTASISGINVNVDSSTKLKEMYNAILAMPTQFWVLDNKNPTYSLGSGVNNFQAVDMIDENNVCSASLDGAYQCWDGNVWTYGSYPGITWYGVGMLESSAPYAWFVGTNGVAGVYSINGATPVTFTDGGTTMIADVMLIRDPNDPNGVITVYLATDTGLFESTDLGVTWTQNLSDVYFSYNQPAPLVTRPGRFSNVIWNSGGSETSPPVDKGFRAILVGGSEITYFNGTQWLMYSPAWYNPNPPYNGYANGLFDATLVHDGVAYIIGGFNNGDVGFQNNVVWRFDYNKTASYPLNTSTDGQEMLTMVFQWSNTTANSRGTGIASSSMDDVWVTTYDPSVFYHYNGFAWEYTSFPYSRYLAITIGFGNFSTLTGLHDIVMSDAYHGYAVGDDGIILKFMNKEDAQFEALLQNLTAQIAAISVNLTPVLNAIQEVNQTATDIYNFVVAMNTSFGADFTALNNKIDQMNASIQYKLDNVLSNVTYTQLYLETTMFPMLNATYQNTILILQDLGIIKSQLNQTIQLQNQTLAIVNATDIKVDQLLNQTAKPKVRAWIQQ